METRELWTTTEAARELGVSRRTVHRLVSSGQLSLYAASRNGWMLFEPSEVYRVKKRRGALQWTFKWDSDEARHQRMLTRLDRGAFARGERTLEREEPTLRERLLEQIRSKGQLKAKIQRDSLARHRRAVS